VGENFILWANQYFSIGFLITRLFSPWHKDISSYGMGFDLQRWSKIFLWNFISRFIGAILRLIIILLGLVCALGIIFLTIIVFVLWQVLPLIILLLLFSGLSNFKL